MKITFKICLLIWCYSTSSAQNDTGNWLMYFGTNRISDSFSIHTELQHRNHTTSPTNIEQLLLRTGLNYHFKPNALATLGYAHIGNYEYDSERCSPEKEEHRIWQQLITSNNLGRIKFEHRYRVEQRFVEKDFKNRFRYRLMLFIPLNSTSSYYLGLYDEVFINGEEDLFDRNRLYAGIGYRPNADMHLQIGFLRQQLSDSVKNFLQFGIIYNTDFRKSKS